MLKNTKGEISTSVAIGIILLIVVIVGLVIWSRSKKTDDLAPEFYNNTNTTNTTDTVDMTGTATEETPVDSVGTSTVPTSPDYQVQINSEAEAPTAPAPVLPQTGLGPNE